MGLVSRPRWVRRQTRVDVDVDVDVVAGQGRAGQGRAPGLKLRASGAAATARTCNRDILRTCGGKGTNEQKPGTTQIEHQSMHKNEGVSCAC